MTREEAIAEIKEKTPVLLADYRALAAQIAEALGISTRQDDTADERPEMGREELEELYGAVLEFAESYDIDSVDMLLKQAKDYRVPEAERETFEKLSRLVRDSDWDGIKELLQ